MSRRINLAIAAVLIVCVELGVSLSASGFTTTIFADDFSGTQLSPAWTTSTAQVQANAPATATVASGLLTLNSTGPSANFLDISVPFTPGGNNLSVTARVRADVFGRFHLALLTQTGVFDPSSVAAAFEFDLTGTLSGDCGNKGAAIERIGGSFSVFSCNTTVGVWYQFQIVATDNPYKVTWNYMNDSGAIIASTTQASTAYSFSSIKYLALGVWANAVESISSLYDMDWTIASSPSPGPVHATSSGSTTLIVNPRTTSTIVNCAPHAVQVSQTTTCTARVVDIASGPTSTPTGIVSWTSSGPGVFNSTTCMLSGTGAQGSCNVSYTPTASGSQVITATYDGDGVQPSTSQQTSINVTNNVLAGPWMLANIIGAVGAAGVGTGAAVTLLGKRRGRKP